MMSVIYKFYVFIASILYVSLGVLNATQVENDSNLSNGNVSSQFVAPHKQETMFAPPVSIYNQVGSFSSGLKRRQIEGKFKTSPRKKVIVHNNNPYTEQIALPAKRQDQISSLETPMSVKYLSGNDAHISAYESLINEAKDRVILASWSLNYIPPRIFNSLMNANRRGVPINLIVHDVQRRDVIKYFNKKIYREGANENAFNLLKTASHSKFLFVDGRSLVLGSYNALNNCHEETGDASVLLKGTIEQLWPFYMSIRKSYTERNLESSRLFGKITAFAQAKWEGERPLLQQELGNVGKIFLLRSLKEHEDFFRLATPAHSHVTIYSPFVNGNNAKNRLKALEELLPQNSTLKLKTLPQFQQRLNNVLSTCPNLQKSTQVEVGTSHQKVVILGDHTICVGSLNWLSESQDEASPYSNVEFSIVLQGKKAASIIRKNFNTSN